MCSPTARPTTPASPESKGQDVAGCPLQALAWIRVAGRREQSACKRPRRWAGSWTALRAVVPAVGGPGPADQATNGDDRVGEVEEGPAPPVEPRELNPWSLDKSLAFLEAARSDPLYPAFVLAVALGLRRGEILGLHWRDVDLGRRTLTVRSTLDRGGKELYLDTTKNRRARVIPVPLMCVAPLRWQRLRQAGQRSALGTEWHDSGLVFTTLQRSPHRAAESVPVLPADLSVSESAAGPPARHPARMRVPALRGRRRAPHGHGDPGALPDRGHHERLHARQR